MWLPAFPGGYIYKGTPERIQAVCGRKPSRAVTTEQHKHTQFVGGSLPLRLHHMHTNPIQSVARSLPGRLHMQEQSQPAFVGGSLPGRFQQKAARHGRAQNPTQDSVSAASPSGQATRVFINNPIHICSISLLENNPAQPTASAADPDEATALPVDSPRPAPPPPTARQRRRPAPEALRRGKAPPTQGAARKGQLRRQPRARTADSRRRTPSKKRILLI